MFASVCAALILTATAVFAQDPPPSIHLRAPADPIPAAGSADPRAPGRAQAPPPSEPPVPFDDLVPHPRRQPRAEPGELDGSPLDGSPLDRSGEPQARKLGSNTTLFINFDGVEISYCDPPDSHANCSWLEDGSSFAPFSGGLAQRVAILDAIRSLVADYGIRVTGQRPPADEPYVMVVYGGDSIAEEALGRAPGGDCWDDFPNDIAHVYLDGERSTWINGGATTALHEAAHTWGLDHIGLSNSLMAPAGDNSKVTYFDGCAQIVDDVALVPSSDPSCPQINLELCGLSDFQYDAALLRLLFGEPYVDDRAPQLRLAQPFDGIYYQAPASFPVVLEVVDDLHPQVYELEIAIPGLVEGSGFAPVLDPSFDVEELPVGEWTFALRLRDAAGNESSLAFTVFVGDEAPILDDGCACRSSPDSAGFSGLSPVWALLVLSFGLGLRPRRADPCAGPKGP